MKYIKNDGNLEDNAVHNRFTAYLKVSLEHNNARYTVKLKQKLFSEIDYPEDEVLSGSYEDPPESRSPAARGTG